MSCLLHHVLGLHPCLQPSRSPLCGCSTFCLWKGVFEEEGAEGWPGLDKLAAKARTRRCGGSGGLLAPIWGLLPGHLLAHAYPLWSGTASDPRAGVMSDVSRAGPEISPATLHTLSFDSLSSWMCNDPLRDLGLGVGEP